MLKSGPVYSETAQCQDCYKCLRHCPVKAIRVAQGHAAIDPARCIACGACVEACPAGAKRVRDDLPQVKAYLAAGRRLAASVAPSFLSEFPGLAPERLVAALRRLGFTWVGETALGAQVVSAHLARTLDEGTGRIFISTACPVAVDLVCKYVPDRVPDLTPLDSPAQAHARLLQERFGADVTVVFIGPCIGKKLEAAARPGLLAAALTFEDVRAWMAEADLDPWTLEPGPEDTFAGGTASEGIYYPIEGGMSHATELNLTTERTRFLTLSGVAAIREALLELPAPGEGNLFLELLACEGGCVRGPKATRRSTVAARMDILDAAHPEPGAYPRPAQPAVGCAFQPRPQVEASWAEEPLRLALLRIGKQGPEDELNCGACGYDTCRALARAILAGHAEGLMCVSNLRRLAEKKANALLRTLPLGVVIVDQDLQIIESNEEFARIMGEDALTAYQAQPGLAGAHLEKFLSFGERFRDVLGGGEELIRQNIQSGGQTLSATIFAVEPRHVAGALLLDVTGEEDRRRQVIGKAEEVIQNLLGNVQEIAFSLGRNAAKSEGILNSIIAEFSGQERPEGTHDA
jgi:iron only hydrogenase large subunit-like protein